MTETERNGTENRPTAKALNLQLSLDPDQATEFMNWLSQVVETSIAASLVGQKREPGTQSHVPDANGPRPAPETKVKGIDVSDAARAKAADLRIDLLLGKIPDSTGILLDTKVTARLLDISPATLDRLRAVGGIPEPVRVGGRIIRWRLAELLEWIEAGCPPRKFWDYKGQGTSQKRAGR
jgi:predicted DNA-binding transcriptional regulator AlpA